MTELAFLWIEKFRSLENLNVNFSSDFEFAFDYNTGKLSQSTKNDLPVKGFYGEKIINLSAIIGENGVGKSSLLECIQIIYDHLHNLYSRDRKKRTRSSLGFVVIFKISDRYYYLENNLKLDIKSSLPALPKTVKELPETHVLFYTNFFDYSTLLRSDHIIDLGTNSLVRYLISSLISKGEATDDYSALGNFFYTFKTREIIAQLEFLSCFDKHIPFKTPSRLSIAARYEVDKEIYLRNPYEDEDEDEGKPNEEEKNYLNAFVILHKLVLLFEKQISKKKSENDHSFKRLIQQAVLINYFEAFVFEQDVVIDYHTLSFDLTKLISHQKISKTTDLDELFVYSIEKVSAYRGVEFDAKGVLTWINEFTSFMHTNATYALEANGVDVDIPAGNSNQFKRLIRQLAEFPISPFLDFYWSGISSGENALITIFSRIYQQVNNLNKNGATILYLLDECEINLHPEWQRKFIKLLTILIPEMIPQSSHQLIISSHSPLMLSDIPKSNVIFLEKQNGRVFTSHLSERKQTFAANIHTLLSDAFFMKEGTLGEVAKEKINWVIDQLNGRYEVFEENLTEIKIIVDLIGEPIIRNKLANMISEKMQINLQNIDSRLRELERKKKK